MAAPSSPPSPADAWSLSAENLSSGYGDRRIVDSVHHEFAAGRITSIIGSNGCGKSTLLRTLARLIKPSGGAVKLAGRPLSDFGSKELARRVAMLPQTPTAPEGISVFDLVGRGRTPYQGLFGRWSSEDFEATARALEDTKIADLADHPVDELSGGQRQRVWIAMALAQQTDVLLLDEPTTYLDLKHQLEVLDLLTDLNRQRGTTIIMVLHDLNLAARYSDELVAMRSGMIKRAGSSHDVITDTTLRDVFDLEASIVADPVSGLPSIMPIGRHHADGFIRQAHINAPH